jgi:hypothetical protein
MPYRRSTETKQYRKRSSLLVLLNDYGVKIVKYSIRQGFWVEKVQSMFKSSMRSKEVQKNVQTEINKDQMFKT